MDHTEGEESLIGARVVTVRAEIEMVTTTRQRKVVADNKKEYKTVQSIGMQFDMFGSMWTGAMLATDLMRQVGELSDVTAEQVRQSRLEYKKAADALAPFKLILDVYTSRWFGNEDTRQSQLALLFLRDGAHMAWLKNPHTAQADLKPDAAKIAATALKAAREKRFFHWELEFPEVFFGPSKSSAQEIVLKGNAGFDAVVGNPPYDELSDDAAGYEIVERAFLADSLLYKPARESGGRSNWYHFFMLLGVHLLKNSCQQGYIVPMSWIGDTFTSGVRKWLLENHRPVIIDCFLQRMIENRVPRC